jgi:hypothetical protein
VVRDECIDWSAPLDNVEHAGWLPKEWCGWMQMFQPGVYEMYGVTRQTEDAVLPPDVWKKLTTQRLAG